MKRLFTTMLGAAALLSIFSDAQAERQRWNFNRDWTFAVGDQSLDDAKKDGTACTLPRAFNETEAFQRAIKEHTDTVSWWWKTFELPASARGQRVFVEFEGARQAAEVYLNGQRLGLHENGVMAFGFDLTPYLRDGRNEIAVRVDNNWFYTEKSSGIKFQWNDRNFNVNYGGLPKNVWLHATDQIYQTLPLYSNLKTTGTYVYATDYNVARKKATIHVESQVINATAQAQKGRLRITVLDADGKQVARFTGKTQLIPAGDTVTLSAQQAMSKLHFWSWGYGYLYTVKSALEIGGVSTDEVTVRTGFRKTQFGQGKVWLNDRVIMVHGFAQRSSNEWPAVGTDIPAWLSDYGNALCVEGNGNLMRWMHVTPGKQEIESCDRVGLMQAMPAGDAEKDREGRQWDQRTEVMRDAIIYNRNNPSIIFYECGNESISREHMIAMKQIRDQYDPYGGRAIGSREMLDINEAEYGGEMLYINTSRKHPMWAMEYCRDEGYRMYWDNYSYPYHQHGAGPFYRKAPAIAYNQNQDSLTIENIIRWDDYYRVRPGYGDRVSSGGVKIIFAETNTHGRSEFNYRVSGVVDAMRIPKDPWYAHQVMWDGWVDVENPRTYIIGHWNYPAGVVKPVHVVSSCDQVELFVNGKSKGKGVRKHDFLFDFDKIAFEPGVIRAVGMDKDGKELASYEIHTAGAADHIELTLIQNPLGMKADGADLAMVQVEIVDKNGRRCPLDNRDINFTLSGEGIWRGGIAKAGDGENHILDTVLPVEAGVNRVFVRSTTTAGNITLKAEAKHLAPVTLEWKTEATDNAGGLSTYQPNLLLPCRLDRGETPATPSYRERYQTVNIVSAESAANDGSETKSFDDNELSEWKNDGKMKTAWITYTLEKEAPVSEINIKLTGWRMRSYPLEVVAESADGTKTTVWKGVTEKSLGYVPLRISNPVHARKYTIRQVGKATEKEAFGQVTELANGAAGELDLFKAANAKDVKGELRIVEIDFLVPAK